MFFFFLFSYSSFSCNFFLVFPSSTSPYLSSPSSLTTSSSFSSSSSSLLLLIFFIIFNFFFFSFSFRRRVDAPNRAKICMFILTQTAAYIIVIQTLKKNGTPIGLEEGLPDEYLALIGIRAAGEYTIMTFL